MCVSNAHILHTKSPNHSSKRALEFREELVSALVEGKCFRKNREFVQAPIANPDKVELGSINQSIGQLAKSISRKLRQYKAVLFVVLERALCLVLKGTTQCKTMFYDVENHDDPWQLKEGRGRPYQRGRRSLRNKPFFV